MRYILLTLCFTSMFSFSQDAIKKTDNLWVQDFDKAMHIADTKGKSILMYFTGSDWCTPCIMLKEDFFNTKKFKEYKSSYVFLVVDIPRNQDLLTDQQRKHNYKLLEKYNKDKSFPLVTILSPKGKLLDEVSGYNSLRDPKYYFELLEKFEK